MRFTLVKISLVGFDAFFSCMNVFEESGINIHFTLVLFAQSFVRVASPICVQSTVKQTCSNAT